MAADSVPSAGADLRDLYTAEHERLEAFIRRRVSDAEAARDIEQETWAGLAHRWGTHRRARELLFAIARRRVVDWYRRRHRVEALSDDEVLFEQDFQRPAGFWLDAVDPGQTVPARVGMERALARLTGRQRQVLILSDIDDLSREQVAAVLGIGAETVKSTLTDARRAMSRNPSMAGYEASRIHTPEVAE
ncbi:RNA polymerase sigma factor [Dactylosporangium cerinum]|uniref:RNA polymerase sigma factor n=1 Tax=Dactylosporangium cerinum TaxID=1434730 RepID=A0ABV9WMT7_9ACTN